jgi:uncharacterized membrane protein YraQ (UPF0718 family)
MKRKEKRGVMDVSTWILLGLTLIALAVAFARGPTLAADGVSSGARLLRSVAPELLLGFLLAGLLDVLVPAATLQRWLGAETTARGIGLSWGLGLLLPGGPYVLFPMAAQLFRAGVAPAAIITLVTAKTLVSPIRMLTYEAPVLGWRMTLSRLLPAVLLPPLVGLAGGMIYRMLEGRLRAP